jgi:hypothetical protein
MSVEPINGTRIPFDLVGHGSGLLLIHGAWAEREIWGSLVPLSLISFRSSHMTDVAMVRAPPLPAKAQSRTT